MRVIGTAGHVDHGKSTLVEALTGVHPDRLKEEREREMTIDLGFAWLTIPVGVGPANTPVLEEVGIVDVPGHRDFIENMLAGIGGIDAALFVVAADEGVMPQTREHLAILDILQIQGGVVALTKVDMVDDPDWLDLVEIDLHQVLAPTVLGQAPIVRVSARTGEGLPSLVAALGACLAERPPRPDLNRPRLPVDRVFTIAGFGSVVTGTLTDGQLKLGDEVEVLPAGLRGRVRGLQTHKRKEEVAVPGGRTAVNISGITLDQVTRGDVIAHPGDYQPDRRLDVRFRLLPDVSQPLEHNTEVKFFIGAAEVLARVRLIGSEKLQPGEQGWLQLELSQPVVAVRGDRYILRRPSPGETLGGGFVVDPHPKHRHKRFAPEALASLEALSQGSPAEVLSEALIALSAAPLKDVIARSNLDSAAASQAVEVLSGAGLMLALEDAGKQPENNSYKSNLPKANDLVVSKAFWERLAIKATQEVESYHQVYPLRAGMPREELKSRLKTFTQVSPRLFNLAMRMLVSEGILVEIGPLIKRPGHTIRFNPEQEQKVALLLRRFAASPYTPPSLKDCQLEAGEDVIAALVDMGRLIVVAPEVVFRKEDYDRMVDEIHHLLEKQGTLTAAQVRDHFNTSRKYALALLEYMDAQGITIREGDTRRLKKLA